MISAVVLVRGTPEVIGAGRWWGRVVRGFRADFATAVKDVEEERRGVLAGMVLGDKAGLSEGVEEEFRASGLLHCMVVSGANLAILTGAVLLGCRWLGVGRRWGALLAGFVLVGFVAVVGTEPSVLRAMLMGTVGLLGLFLGRERQGIAGLAATVIVLVLVDPALAREYGFVLSVTASAGLLVIAPRVRDALMRRRVSRRAAEALAVPIAAQIAVSLVLLLLAGSVNLISVPANVLAEPGIVVATVTGSMAAFIAPVSPGVAAVPAQVASVAVGWVMAVARTAAAVPHGSVPWAQSLLGAVLLIATVVLLALALRRRSLRRLLLAAFLGVAAGISVLHTLRPGWPPPGWRLVVCDVGQGDALVLWAGPGQAVVVDAGPEPGPVDRCLRELSIQAIPLLVLTHPHADHVAGLPGAVRGRKIGTVLHSPSSSLAAEFRALSAAGL
ncbi:ComEC/Rec2 family competence protein, partial [Actinocorallia lasiicapitis]